MRPIPGIATVTVVVLLALAPTSAVAFQRMGLVVGGSARIGPGGGGELPSRCLDQHAQPPTMADTFTQVLDGSPDAVEVKKGRETVSLKEAIKRRWIRISGWSRPIPGRLAEISRLRVENKTKEPIEIKVKKTTVIGGPAHRPLDVDVPHLDGTGSQRAVWDDIERQRKRRSRPPPIDAKHQQALAKLGFYKGRTNGRYTVETEAAVQRFRAAHGIREQKKGALGPETKRELDRAVAEHHRLQEISRQGVLLLKLEPRALGAARYRLQTPKGELQESESAAGVPKMIEQALAGSKETRVLLDVSALPPNKRDALKTSLHLSRKTPFRILERRDTAELLFSKDVRLENVSTPTKVANRFEMRATFRHRAGRIVLRVRTKSREVLEAFKARLTKLFGKKTPGLTIGGAVERTRTELRKQFRFDDEDLEVLIMKETEPLEVVRVLMRRPHAA